ncbi:GNAT family N-acetyltransferase [Pirellulales bacterium]|nr:GNAT family N-acetyltransferase [Pirellulales bacterium]
MITYRCFRNDDPPRLAEVWRTADLGSLAMQPMTTAELEAGVFSKPYFDRRGLIVATENDQIVGFAHAGFGPTADQKGIDTQVGSTLLAVVPPHALENEISDQLLMRCERYLQQSGSTCLLGGGNDVYRGFYLGLYGGSDLPGILDSSPKMQQMFERAGYRQQQRITVHRRPLEGFRVPVNRLHIAIRRRTVMHVIDEPERRTWWEAATTTGIALRRYELRNKTDDVLGSATFWDMQPLSQGWGVVAAGLLHVDIEGPRRRQGLAQYLIAEAMHDLSEEGVALIEAHTTDANVAAAKLFEKLDFSQSGQGTLFEKVLP